MSELIERAALLAALDYGRTHNAGVRQIVSEAPTVDAVSVVRCRDCAKRNTCDCPMGYAVEWGIGNEMPGDGDYCCYGARMDADAPERAGKDGRDG